MQEVKLSKLNATLDQYAGRQASFKVEHKDVNITITGQLKKNHKQYWFTNDSGKVVIEQKKAGSVMTLKGTYKVFSVKFLVKEQVLAEFEIPAKGGRLQLDVDEA